MFLGFPAQAPGPGASTRPSYVCMKESMSKLMDAVGFVGVRLEADTSLRSLGNTRVGDGAIEGPIAFADVCVPCVRVPGVQAHQGPGPVQARTQLRVHVRSPWAVGGPGTLLGSSCPPSPKAAKLLCSWGGLRLGQSLSLHFRT